MYARMYTVDCFETCTYYYGMFQRGTWWQIWCQRKWQVPMTLNGWANCAITGQVGMWLYEW